MICFVINEKSLIFALQNIEETVLINKNIFPR